MILELDLGNSLIKWRLLAGEGQACVARGSVRDEAQLMAELGTASGMPLHAGRAVSVRGDDETRALLRSLQQGLGVQITRAAPAKSLAGVSNGYCMHSALGLDRWLAVVAAYQRAQGACLVLDVGTAVTADLVDADGHHLGGYIGPGLALMRDQLFTHTSRIRYTPDSAALRDRERPGCSTLEAVERGCLVMLLGFVQEQLSMARQALDGDFRIFITGGDGELLQALLAAGELVPDLVFEGLALACPVEERA